VSGRRCNIGQVSQQIGKSLELPGIVRETMPGEVDGDRLDLQLACDLEWQWAPGIDVDARLVQQERDIRSGAPAKSAQHRSPRYVPFDRLRTGYRAVAYVPHSLCL
jgi:hypothetical protein